MVLREVEIGKFTIMSTSTKTLFWTFLLQMILFLSDQNFNLVRPPFSFSTITPQICAIFFCFPLMTCDSWIALLVTQIGFGMLVQRRHSSSFTNNGWEEKIFRVFGALNILFQVFRSNGLEILILKHMWKNKIGPLQQIWASKRYGTFFWDTLY